MPRSMKKYLTNETLLKKFQNSFDFVNYVISETRQFIKSERAPLVSTHLRNPALIVLEEVMHGELDPTKQEGSVSETEN